MPGILFAKRAKLLPSVYTDGPAVLYLLRSEDLSRIEAQDPQLASAFHRFIVRLVASRLILANEELQMRT